MNRGEIAGLEYSNKDFNEKVLYVRHSLNYLNGKTYLDTPKTDGSQRELPLSDNLIALFKAHKATQAKNKLCYGALYKKNIYNNRECDFIFTWENGQNLQPIKFKIFFKQRQNKEPSYTRGKPFGFTSV